MSLMLYLLQDIRDCMMRDIRNYVKISRRYGIIIILSMKVMDWMTVCIKNVSRVAANKLP